MKQGIKWLCLFVSALFLFLASAHAEDEKKIGVIVALSGPVAPTGESIRNAIGLADKKFDRDGKVEFVFEDDQFQAKQAVTAAEKLINQDKVDALVSFSGATSAAVSEVAERRKVPLVTITSLGTLGKNKNMVFTLFVSEDQQVGLLSAEIAKRGYKKIALVTTVQDAVMGMRKNFAAKNSSLIVRDEEVLPGDTNLNSVVTRIQVQKPEAVVLFTLPPQLSVLSRQLRDQGFSAQFFGGPPMYNPPEILAAKGALEGALLPGPSTKNADEFLASYEREFHIPCISEGFYGYDVATLLIQAVSSGDILGYLNQKKSFEGLSGTYPQNEAKVFQVPGELKQITATATLKKFE